jgi:hypothetical protein
VTAGRPFLAATLTATLAAFLTSSSSAQFQNVDLVDVDVVVTDDDGKPVTRLKKDDFDVREDGKPVELKTFVSLATSEDMSVPRSMVILLDDVTMPTETVNAVKALATYLALQARPIDDLSVIRFRNQDDEPFGDRRRKVLVCIGAPRICAIREPGRFAGGWFYGDWAAAATTAARISACTRCSPRRRAFPATTLSKQPAEQPSATPATSGRCSIASGRTPVITTCSATGRQPRRKTCIRSRSRSAARVFTCSRGNSAATERPLAGSLPSS